jgi:hypothetical protein
MDEDEGFIRECPPLSSDGVGKAIVSLLLYGVVFERGVWRVFVSSIFGSLLKDVLGRRLTAMKMTRMWLFS